MDGHRDKKAGNSGAGADITVNRQNFFCKEIIVSVDWIRTAQIIQDNLLYLKSTIVDLNHNLRNTFTTTPGLVFDEITEYYHLDKLTHKTNHHTIF